MTTMACHGELMRAETCQVIPMRAKAAKVPAKVGPEAVNN